MFTTHNFKMLYVYIDDIMGGLHASDLVVLIIFHLLFFLWLNKHFFFFFFFS